MTPTQRVSRSLPPRRLSRSPQRSKTQVMTPVVKMISQSERLVVPRRLPRKKTQVMIQVVKKRSQSERLVEPRRLPRKTLVTTQAVRRNQRESPVGLRKTLPTLSQKRKQRRTHQVTKKAKRVVMMLI